MVTDTEHTLILRPTERMGTKGRIYEALFDGEVIAKGTSPECGACRELQSRGLDGYAVFWREGKPHPDMRMSIAWGAGRYVAEDKMGMRFAKWTPFKLAGEELEEAEAA